LNDQPNSLPAKIRGRNKEEIRKESLQEKHLFHKNPVHKEGAGGERGREYCDKSCDLHLQRIFHAKKKGKA